MTEIVWEDPGLPGFGGHRARSDWSRLMEEVKKRPKKWARLRGFEKRHQAHGAASRLRTGMTQIPKGSWEFTVRRKDDDIYYLYARYLGVKK